MNVFIVKIGEPLPGEGFRERRMTKFCDALIAAGHKVTWWTSDWSHQKLAPRDESLVEIAKHRSIDLRMIHAVGYHKNISIKRFRHHSQFARSLIKHLDSEVTPDLIWVCFPTVPVTVRVSRWAAKNDVSVVFDIRDISPDIFVKHAPAPIRPLIHKMCQPIRAAIGKSFSAANGLVGVSQGYLDWATGLAEKYGAVPEKSRVLPLGYKKESYPQTEDLEKFKVELERSGFVDSCSVRMVYAGGLGTSYDLTTIIKAVDLAVSRGFKGVLAIAAGGRGAEDIYELAKKSQGVICFGWLTPDKLQLLLRSCNVGMMAYSAKATQGLPNKIYEYLAHELVILNSLQGEAEELVANNGLGFNYKSGDYNHLADIILRLEAEGSTLQDMSRRSGELFRSQFDEDKAVKDMVQYAVSVVEDKV